MAVSVFVDDAGVLVGLGEAKATVSDKNNLLMIAGNLMRASVARTFREQGSPAHSWVGLAESTKKKKGYTAGHRLLIMSGRLFSSITYIVANGILTIGTNLVYAAVHQFGSKDRKGGAIGPQARIAGRAVGVNFHERTLVAPFKRYGTRQIVDKRGRTRTVRVRAAGPANATHIGVREHFRFQNIPARPYLVFRPEDPDRIRAGFESYLGGKLVSLGKVGA